MSFILSLDRTTRASLRPNTPKTQLDAYENSEKQKSTTLVSTESDVGGYLGLEKIKFGAKKGSGESSAVSLEQFEWQSFPYSESLFDVNMNSGCNTTDQVIVANDRSDEAAMKPFEFAGTYAINDSLGEMSHYNDARGTKSLAGGLACTLDEPLFHSSEVSSVDGIANQLCSSVNNGFDLPLQQTAHSSNTEEELATQLALAMQSPQQITQSSPSPKVSSHTVHASP